MNSIKINDIEIDLLPGPIGISHSGGADSTVLLYILMKYHPGPIHVITASVKTRFGLTPYVSLDIISKCMDLTNRNDIFHHTYYIETVNEDTLFRYQSHLLSHKLVNYIYTGVTATPPLDVCDTFKNGRMWMDERDPTIVRPLYTGIKKSFYRPFFNHNKKDIQQLYQTLDIIDTLFPLTRSCFLVKDHHCGKCWWCEERQWAFGRL